MIVIDALGVKQWSALLPEVNPFVGGAPEALVLNAIRNAVIEFCERSWAYVADTTPLAMVAKQQDYRPIPPAGTAIAQILYGYYNGKIIWPTTKDDALKLDQNWRNRTGTRVDTFIAAGSGSLVSVIPVPSVAVPAVVVSPNVMSNGLVLTAAIKPARDAKQFPAHLYERYLEEIAHGAVARVLSIPHKVWSNVNAALFHRNAFLDGASQARADASKGFTRAALRSRPRGVANW